MNAELKAKWVEALRSGEYRQGEGRLYDNATNTFCCLGVLCKITGMSLLGADREGLELGPSQRQKVGVSMAQMIELTTRNDGSGGRSPHSFPQLADYIDANL